MRIRLTHCLAGILVALIPTTSSAQTNSTWNGTTGNWTDATRWSTNPIFPNNGQPSGGDLYNAIISSGTVTLDQNIVIQGLTLGAGGAINGSSNLTANAASVFSGFMTGSGTTTFNGPLTLDTGSGINRNIINNSVTTWNGSIGINNSTGTWTNQNGATFDIQNNQPWFVNAGFNNQAGATLIKSAGSGLSTLQLVNNSGSILVNIGTLELVSGSSSGAGTFSVASGATLRLGNYTIAAGTGISGAGGLNITLSTTINGSYTATGPVTISGTGTFNTPATLGGLTLSSSGLLNGSGNIIVNGATTWIGQMAGSGTTTFNGPVSLTTGNGINRNIINTGTTTWSGNSSINNSTCNWTNQNGAVFDIQNDQALLSQGVATFNNQAGATFRKSAGSSTSTIAWAFNNAGSVDALSGTLAFNGGFTQTGGVTRLNGGAITSTSEMLFNAGSVVGSGLVGSAARFGNATIAPGASAGTITVGGNLVLNAGTSLNFELGSQSDLINVNGNLTLDGTLNVAALPGFGAGTFTILDYTGTLTNNVLDLGSVPDGFDYQLIVDSANTRIDLLVTTAVPEPASIIMGTTFVLGSGAYTWRRYKKIKRRKRSKHKEIDEQRDSGQATLTQGA